jgi:hypothetical protein
MSAPPMRTRSSLPCGKCRVSLGAADSCAGVAVVEAGHDRAACVLALETAAILDVSLDRPDRPDRAGERSEEALGLHRALGDARGVARILDGRAMATLLDGRIADDVALFVTPSLTCGSTHPPGLGSSSGSGPGPCPGPTGHDHHGSRSRE